MPKDEVLNWPVINFSDTDRATWHAMVEGCLILGAPGAGKSSTAGKQLAYGLLNTPHSGALILTAKSEEVDNWRQYADACGRGKDVVLFNEQSGHVMDPLFYEFNRAGRGNADIENTVDFFSTLSALGEDEKKGTAHDPFWSRGNEQTIRNCLKLLELAQEIISIPNIDRLIKSLPTRPEEIEDASWQKDSYCGQLVECVKARKQTLTQEQWSVSTLQCSIS
jgi:hypothetical protein